MVDCHMRDLRTAWRARRQSTVWLVQLRIPQQVGNILESQKICDEKRKLTRNENRPATVFDFCFEGRALEL